MLSVAAESVSEIVKRYGDVECTYEFKYDGVRVQLILSVTFFPDPSIPLFTSVLSMFAVPSKIFWYFATTIKSCNLSMHGGWCR